MPVSAHRPQQATDNLALKAGLVLLQVITPQRNYGFSDRSLSPSARQAERPAPRALAPAQFGTPSRVPWGSRWTGLREFRCGQKQPIPWKGRASRSGRSLAANGLVTMLPPCGPMGPSVLTKGSAALPTTFPLPRSPRLQAWQVVAKMKKGQSWNLFVRGREEKGHCSPPGRSTSPPATWECYD